MSSIYFLYLLFICVVYLVFNFSVSCHVVLVASHLRLNISSAGRIYDLELPTLRHGSGLPVGFVRAVSGSVLYHVLFLHFIPNGRSGSGGLVCARLS